MARVRRGTFTCVGWQVTLCDPIRQVIKEIFDDKNDIRHLLLYITLCQQKMADIIFIVKNLLSEFFITFINATKVYSIYRPTLILGHVVLGFSSLLKEAANHWIGPLPHMCRGSLH